ncbi:variant erythrocyte surface antigen-1 family protein [Babesia caballi]|uniref:Variant erythrocyte surface antigen-1 family protein n=1 Tax=Babesia caballi TaxID=5871 RepID=A0AAV4LX82_BABCB|nr:variant erythrocyte surface antigen-1 family protein [Babesia caballi]
MKMTGSGQKSLTEAPKDLKEAIDWVLRVSGGDGYGGSDVIKLVEALKECDVINVYNLYNNLQSHINTLANALKNFIGYAPSGTSGSDFKIDIGGNGIITKGNIYSRRQGSPRSQNKKYTSAYYGAAWGLNVEIGYVGQKQDNKKKALQSFLTAIQIIFERLTELYLKCKTEWKSNKLDGSSGGTGLKQFMEKNGFDNTQLNTTMTGEQIISKAFTSFTEFSKAYTAVSSNPSLDTFRYQLQKNAWSNPSNYPLSALYILATPAYSETSITTFKASIATLGATALAGGAYALNLGGFATSLNSFFGFT